MSNKHSSIVFLAGVAILIAAPILKGALPSPGPILYVSDMTANTIYAITPTGTRSPFVSCGTCQPEGLAFDAAGNLYVADFNNGTIREYSSTGVLINANFITGLSLPVGLAFDVAGNLYVSDLGTGTIKKFGPNGGAIPLLTFGVGLTPYALAFDAAGILYEADFKPGVTGAINRFTTAGTALTPFVTGLDYPKGLAFDAVGNLYVSKGGPQDVEKFSPTGAALGVFASGFSDPFGLAFDAAGNLYVADYGNGTITKFDPTGAPTPFASGMQNPTFLAFEPGGVFQVHYASNLDKGDSIIDMTNTGNASNNSICVNVYTFAPDEQLISCCACPITPNGLAHLSVHDDLISNVLTPAVPTSVTVKLIATELPTTGCNAATIGTGTNLVIGNGLAAWATTLHGSPTVPPTFGNPTSYSVTETPFLSFSGGTNEVIDDGQLCHFVGILGSGFGICKSCTLGGLGAARQ